MTKIVSPTTDENNPCLEISSGFSVCHTFSYEMYASFASNVLVVSSPPNAKITPFILEATRPFLVVIGSLLIINGLPESHLWYEETFVHQEWNRLIEMTPIPAEFDMEEHDIAV